MVGRPSLPAALAVLSAIGCSALACSSAGCARAAALAAPPTIVTHPVRVDAEHKLLSWSKADGPYAHVARIAWEALETRFPPQDNGLETWLANSRFDPDRFEGINWPHNPAGLYAMLTDSAVLWYAFSGDRAAVALARKALDHQLAHGTTPRGWSWPNVPYASANAGDAEYRGADDEWCSFCGRGDGLGVIEPDKVGELGFAYLQMFELSGEERYRDAAVACADALASHAREGDEKRSPWPFRVYAQTNVAREEYSSNVIGALMLFDELGRLSLGDTGAYARARTIAFDWLMRVPIRNDAWSGYFEDIDIQVDPAANPNLYSAMRTARWLLPRPGRPAANDPDWRQHVSHLLTWVTEVFGGDTATERGLQWGARVMGEQAVDMVKMGSHTARFGATCALWFEATGDAGARERAARSLNWATYTCSEDGVVAVGQDANEGWWFSDGYGDYIRHFLVAMGAVPEWAPRANHILRSTSVVRHVDYAPGRVAWTTFDDDATETLRLESPPARVTAAGKAIGARPDTSDEGYALRALGSAGVVVQVRHRMPGEVVIELGTGGGVAGEVDLARGGAGASGTAGGCAVSRSAAAGGGSVLTAMAVAAFGWRRRRTSARAWHPCG